MSRLLRLGDDDAWDDHRLWRYDDYWDKPDRPFAWDYRPGDFNSQEEYNTYIRKNWKQDCKRCHDHERDLFLVDLAKVLYFNRENYDPLATHPNMSLREQIVKISSVYYAAAKEKHDYVGEDKETRTYGLQHYWVAETRNRRIRRELYWDDVQQVLQSLDIERKRMLRAGPGALRWRFTIRRTVELRATILEREAQRPMRAHESRDCLLRPGAYDEFMRCGRGLSEYARPTWGQDWAYDDYRDYGGERAVEQSDAEWLQEERIAWMTEDPKEYQFFEEMCQTAVANREVPMLRSQMKRINNANAYDGPPDAKRRSSSAMARVVIQQGDPRKVVLEQDNAFRGDREVFYRPGARAAEKRRANEGNYRDSSVRANPYPDVKAWNKDLRGRVPVDDRRGGAEVRLRSIEEVASQGSGGRRQRDEGNEPKERRQKLSNQAMPKPPVTLTTAANAQAKGAPKPKEVPLARSYKEVVQLKPKEVTLTPVAKAEQKLRDAISNTNVPKDPSTMRPAGLPSAGLPPPKGRTRGVTRPTIAPGGSSAQGASPTATPPVKESACKQVLLDDTLRPLIYKYVGQNTVHNIGNVFMTMASRRKTVRRSNVDHFINNVCYNTEDFHVFRGSKFVHTTPETSLDYTIRHRDVGIFLDNDVFGVIYSDDVTKFEWKSEGARDFTFKKEMTFTGPRVVEVDGQGYEKLHKLGTIYSNRPGLFYRRVDASYAAAMLAGAKMVKVGKIWMWQVGCTNNMDKMGQGIYAYNELTTALDMAADNTEVIMVLVCTRTTSQGNAKGVGQGAKQCCKYRETYCLSLIYRERPVDTSTFDSDMGLVACQPNPFSALAYSYINGDKTDHSEFLRIFHELRTSETQHTWNLDVNSGLADRVAAWLHHPAIKKEGTGRRHASMRYREGTEFEECPYRDKYFTDLEKECKFPEAQMDLLVFFKTLLRGFGDLERACGAAGIRMFRSLRRPRTLSGCVKEYAYEEYLSERERQSLYWNGDM